MVAVSPALVKAAATASNLAGRELLELDRVESRLGCGERLGDVADLDGERLLRLLDPEPRPRSRGASGREERAVLAKTRIVSDSRADAGCRRPPARRAATGAARRARSCACRRRARPDRRRGRHRALRRSRSRCRRRSRPASARPFQPRCSARPSHGHRAAACRAWRGSRRPRSRSPRRRPALRILTATSIAGGDHRAACHEDHARRASCDAQRLGGQIAGGNILGDQTLDVGSRDHGTPMMTSEDLITA